MVSATSQADNGSLTVGFVAGWAMGDTIEQIVFGSGLDEEATNNVRAIMNLVAAGLSWMTQKVVVISPHQVGRGTRKRADARAIVHTTSVIQLRRTESVKRDGEGRTVEWSHRWMVQEFYRNQYYPSTGRHERILIAAFVKGPSDKPLVLKDKVYVVNR